MGRNVNFSRNLRTHKAHTPLGSKKRPLKTKEEQSLTFQKGLESWDFLQFYDIWIIADIPGGLRSWGYHHNVVHFCPMLGWRRRCWKDMGGNRTIKLISTFHQNLTLSERYHV